MELEEFGEFVADADGGAHDGGAVSGNAVSSGARDFGDESVGAEEMDEARDLGARACYAGDSRVELVVGEIGEFFAQRPGPYELVHLGSLHHVPHYVNLVRQAAACVSRGGAIYILEGFLRNRLERLVARADENLYELMTSPALWFPKLWRKIGFRSKVADMWQLAGEAEVHAKAGLDDMAIAKALQESGFDIVVRERECLPASYLTWLLLSPFGYQNVFRMLARMGATK